MRNIHIFFLFFWSNTTVCLIIYVLCKSCKHEIVQKKWPNEVNKNNFRFTNLTKRVNQLCRALEILKKISLSHLFTCARKNIFELYLCALPFLLRCGNHFSWQDQYARLATLSKTSTLLALDAFSLCYVEYETRGLPQTRLIESIFWTFTE